MGYVSGGGKCFTARLAREVLAYRKVNDMDRTKKAGPGLLKSVFEGEGGYTSSTRTPANTPRCRSICRSWC